MVRHLRQGRLDHLQRWLAQLNAQDIAALCQGLEALSRVMQTDSELRSGDDWKEATR